MLITDFRNSFKAASIRKKIGYILLFILGLIIILIAAGILLAPDYSKVRTPAGYPVNSTQYIPLDEKFNIFTSVWLPDDLQSGEKIPTLVQSSRYLTMVEPGPLMKLMQTYTGAKDENHATAQRVTSRGYAYVFIQMPGTVGSTGPRYVEYMPNEIDAIGEVLKWVSDQSWSNGKFGAFGTSYAATTADFAASIPGAGVKAVVPNAPDFDAYNYVIRPGGVLSTMMADIWGAAVHAMDIDDICQVLAADRENKEIPFWECWATKLYIKGAQHPSAGEMHIFDQAIKEHAYNPDVEAIITGLEYKDEHLRGISQNAYVNSIPPYSMDDYAYYRYKDKAEKAQVNNLTIASWMDAGVVEGALQKFLTFNTPLKIIIYPRGHGTRFHVDPFAPTRALTPGEKAEDWDQQIAFFDTYLKSTDSIPPQKREIEYFTYGINRWQTTTVWPPSGVKNETWFFGPDNQLSPIAPLNDRGSDRYKVDYTASTGFYTRWTTQMGWKVDYGDRREADKKLLVYDSLPLEADTEVTGSPTVNLFVASTHKDGAFHVYLEDIDPEGRVSMLTEGALRAIHRKISDPDSAPFVPLGVYHSLSKKDAEFLVPGEITRISLTLYPISTVFKKGHRIRVAIAGYDQGLGDRYPKEGDPVLTIERNRHHASNIDLPIVR